MSKVIGPDFVSMQIIAFPVQLPQHKRIPLNGGIHLTALVSAVK
jgi:hypothetical protein